MKKSNDPLIFELEMNDAVEQYKDMAVKWIDSLIGSLSMKKDDKSLDLEIEMENAVEQYKQQAVKNLVAAFNEGYMLGRKHAEYVYGEDKNGGR